MADRDASFGLRSANQRGTSAIGITWVVSVTGRLDVALVLRNEAGTRPSGNSPMGAVGIIPQAVNDCDTSQRTR